MCTSDLTYRLRADFGAAHLDLKSGSEACDFPGGSDGKASVYDVGDLGSIRGLGRSLGEGNSNPFQYYCLEKSMDREAW